MDNNWVTGYQSEIERCKKLYQNFEAGAGFVKAVFDSLNHYFEKHPDQAPPLDHLAPPAEESADKMRQDKSLNLQPAVDSQLFSTLFKMLSKEAVKVNPGLKKLFAQIEKEMDLFVANNQSSVTVKDIWAFHDRLVEETALSVDMATFLFSMVLSTIYRQQLESISEVLRTDLYEGGECPLCGEKPHYGSLKSESGAKELECWLCGTRWVHTRVKCPYCSNEDREKLGYFTVEGNDLCRVNYCHNCCCYCKIIYARKFGMDGGLILAIHNLASLDYDLLARKEGFNPGSGLEWVNEEEVSDRQD